jgi:hypothetical protein
MPSVTELLTDPDGRSAAAWARRHRAQWLRRRFPDLPDMRVLDLGGEPHTWLRSDWHPREVVLLNLDWRADAQRDGLRAGPGGDWIQAVGGDACNPPETLRRERFDLVFSNSVIEHVGGHARRKAFAAVAESLGEHHWIQTPNRYFPIEPHWVCPGFQYLPPRGRAAVSRVWPIGSFTERRGPLRQRLEDALEIELLSASELRHYFPGSELLRERFAGLTKSLVATR